MKGVVMKCNEICELMPEMAAGVDAVAPEVKDHLQTCADCAGKLNEFRQTMALLDEWQAPEPSPYFDVRLQARLREEMARPQAGWLAWFRHPVLAAALTVAMALGVGLFFNRNPGDVVAVIEVPAQSAPGTAVSDLQALDKNHDLYSDFDLLDDLEVQHDVVANP
jgi:anti-sigma-K factor RskA